MSETRWFVTGGGGQLATELERRLVGDVFIAREAALDIRDARGVTTAIRGFAPDVVLHTAAYTDVDGAETDEETAFEVNALGTRNVIEAVRGTKAHVVYFSTDYVFSGRKGRPYVEHDEPDPINAYGRTKLAGERETLAWVRGTVVRTAWLFSATGRNFVATILSQARKRVRTESEEPIRVVDDQVGSPTCAGHLAEAVQQAFWQGLGPGIVHMAGGGECTWCDLAREVVQLAGLDVAVEPMTTREAGRAAARPAYSALRSERDVPSLPHWLEGVREVMDELLAEGP
ncbi:MAG TPA: dTDP-4-dehydrorhamnose reductase [Thermoleophilia bacterium]|nr:dTDP-4-dehydrorhamnose reductase [Thermoleophilia bacterium]